MTEIELNEKIEVILADTPVREKERRAKRARAREIKVRKNDELLKIVSRHYVPHAGYVDWGFEGRTLLHSGYHIKYQKNSKCQRWMKRLTYKKARGCSEFVGKGNQYRRIFDYWWTLY